MEAFASKPNALPKLTFKDKTFLGAGKDRVEVRYFGAGHTDGDAWVFFPALHVVHAGDRRSRIRSARVGPPSGVVHGLPGLGGFWIS